LTQLVEDIVGRLQRTRNLDHLHQDGLLATW
jgi:hypothetical protein